MVAALRCDADTSAEIFAAGLQCPSAGNAISAVGLAAVLDSQRGEVLMVPLLLNSGICINQADSSGRRVLDFASFEPLRDYLIRFGAVPGSAYKAGPFARAGHADLPAMVVPVADWPASMCPLRSDEWPGALPSDLCESLRRAGFHGAEALGDTDAGRTRAPPLVYLAYAERIINGALLTRDIPRVAYLLASRPASGVGDYVGVAAGCIVGGLSPTTLAAMLDSEQGTPALLNLLISAGIDVTRPDALGRTALHLTDHPVVRRFLFAHGVDPWLPDTEGRVPFDTFDEDLRIKAEARRLASLHENDGPRAHRKRL